MTAKQKYQNSKTWQHKVLVINIYHLYMRTKKEWSVRKTAHYFGISVGNVSESLKLYQHFDKVKHAPSRKKALGML